MLNFVGSLVTEEGKIGSIKIRAKNLELATMQAGRKLIGYFADRKIEPGKIWTKNGLRVSVIVEPE